MMPRKYEDTHRWLTFKYRTDASPLWAALGEAFSKCQHMAGTPLQPDAAARLSRFFMIKGAVATTAIEGNTLTEDEVSDLIDGKARLPASQQYQEQEVRNVMEGLTNIMNGQAKRDGDGYFRVTKQWIKEQNALILRDLEVEDHVVPGEFTQKQLVVGNVYKAAPPEDVDFLMDKLVTWIDEWLAPCHDESVPDHQRFYQAFFAATLAHLYIAWIHPFGDGNGRTARLLECAILAYSGCVPWISSNLLSDHYNRTRPAYYRRLREASQNADVDGFLRYAAEGYVEQLREQIKVVQAMQRQVAWINYVHEAFHEEPRGVPRERRRDVALAIPEDRSVSRRELRLLNPEIAAMYARTTDKTLTRDINRLAELRLVRRVRGGYQSNIQMIDAFRPIAWE